VDIQNIWLKQEHAKGTFTVTYIKTSKMLADGLTKALPRQAHERFLAHLNLYDISNLTGKQGYKQKEQVNRAGDD
jgi:hypothetical protein